MAYKMIVLDLDDTLLKNDHSISERTKEALMEAQKNGVKVVLASGRPTYAMLPIAKELSLETFGSCILSYNGAKIINCQTKEEIFSSTLTIEQVHKLYDLSRREGVFIHTYLGDEIITDQMNPYTEIESRITGLPLKLVEDFKKAVSLQPIVKLLMVEDPEKLIKAEEALKLELDEHFSITRSKPYFLEFTKKGITKGDSLQRLIKMYGIKREEVIAVGDSFNDLTMIQFAGLGVAMGNASAEIKEHADFITDTNMNDGVAKVVEQFILKHGVHA